jgi:hypothetical protein
MKDFIGGLLSFVKTITIKDWDFNLPFTASDGSEDRISLKVHQFLEACSAKNIIFVNLRWTSFNVVNFENSS